MPDEVSAPFTISSDAVAAITNKGPSAPPRADLYSLSDEGLAARLRDTKGKLRLASEALLNARRILGQCEDNRWRDEMSQNAKRLSESLTRVFNAQQAATLLEEEETALRLELTAIHREVKRRYHVEQGNLIAERDRRREASRRDGILIRAELTRPRSLMERAREIIGAKPASSPYTGIESAELPSRTG